jgi:protein tyrosine phosphatase
MSDLCLEQHINIKFYVKLGKNVTLVHCSSGLMGRSYEKVKYDEVLSGYQPGQMVER